MNSMKARKSKRKLDTLPVRENQSTLGENDQQTADKYRIPTPKRGDFFRNLKHAANASPPRVPRAKAKD